MLPLDGKKMTDYSESVWRSLGHPAFEDDYSLVIEEPEWWATGEAEKP
jgi:hypothetical protein